MKFQTNVDAQLFLVEIGRLDLVEGATRELEPDPAMLEAFIAKRRELIKPLKNFRRSQATKAAWRTHRQKFMRGVDRFRRSTTAKRFHRELGRFLATRVTRDKSKHRKVGDTTDKDRKMGTRRSEELAIYEAGAALKSLSSVKTHAYIELEYYQPVEQEVDYWLFLEQFLPLVSSVEGKVLGEQLADITDEELDVLLRASDQRALMIGLGLEIGTMTEAQVEERWGKDGLLAERHQRAWDGAVNAVVGAGVADDEDGYYLKLVDNYTRLLGATDESRPNKHHKLQHIRMVQPSAPATN